MKYLTSILLVFLVGCITYNDCHQPIPNEPRIQVEFLDGDTFRYNGETVRLLGCDTAEADSPHHRGNQEPYASQATEFVKEACRTARTIVIRYADTDDKYGRRLAHLVLDGIPLAVLLVEARLAYETVSHFGDNGYPYYAEQILAAVGKDPEFEKPHLWRRSHR